MDGLPTGTHGGAARDATATRAGSSYPDVAEPGLSRWTLVALWSTVVGFGLITLARSAQLDIPLRDPHGRLFSHRLALALALALGFALADAVLASLRHHRTLRTVPQVLRERWPWRRTWPVATGLLAYHLVYVSYRNLKSWDAFNHNHDGDLARVDRAIFGGHTPAVLLHDLLGQHYAAVSLAAAYDSFTKVVTASVVGTLVFVRPVRRGYLFLCSAVWIWILGTATYYAIPSLGPFASSPADFAGLTHTSVTDSQTSYLASRAHLLADPGAHTAFASISAFASLHVGVTCLVMLMAFRYGRRVLGTVLGVYLAVIVVATIYTGMHFVVDDVAGVLIAVLAVKLGQLTVGAGVSPRPAPADEATS